MKRFTYILILLFTISFYYCYAKDTDARIIQALSLMEKEQYDFAFSLFEDVLFAKPKQTVALYNAAYCAINIGRADIATKYLNRFIAINKQDADVYNLLGLSLERLGETDSAITNYNQCIKLEKNYYEAYFNRGRCLVAKKMFPEALKDFAYAKKSKNINPELYMQSAELFLSLRQLEDAINDLEKIKKYKSDDIRYLSMFADVYYRSNKFEEAIQYYTKYLRIDSQNVAILNNRALCFDNLDLHDKANEDRTKIEDIQKKEGIDPSTVTFSTMINKDSTFSIELPDEWRKFLSQNNDSDIVVFLNPEYDYNFENEQINFTCGGTIIYYPIYFDSPTESMNDRLNMRDKRQSDYVYELKNNRQANYSNYFETFHKTYNPNEKWCRELSKFTFTDTTTNEQYIGIDYYILTTSGRFIALYIYAQEAAFFKYEAIFNAIQDSMTALE